MTPIKRTLNHADIERRPELVWNAFVDLLAGEDYDDLSATQRVAHLAFWYDSEVQNGGHGQYFDNIGLAKAKETITALEAMELECQAAVLRTACEAAERQLAVPLTAEKQFRALLRWLMSSRAPQSPSPYQMVDEAYYRCSPTIVDALEAYLARYRSEFLEEQP